MSSPGSPLNEDLGSRIALLSTSSQNEDFLKTLRSILESLSKFKATEADTKIFKNVLPAVKDQLEKVYGESFSLYETMDDDMISMLIKQNLEVSFDITENLQEIVNFVIQHAPVTLNEIESLLNHLPGCILSFTNHFKTSNNRSSSDKYKNDFISEISKILEVVKHLYTCFLSILETSLEIQKTDTDMKCLRKALIFVCDMAIYFCDVDGALLFASWKFFMSFSAKNSTIVENNLDLEIPFETLSCNILRILSSLQEQDADGTLGQVQILMFLTKVLLKLTDIFYQHLDKFAPELIKFYVQFLSSDILKKHVFSSEVVNILHDIFENLNIHLKHLIIGQVTFRQHLERISEYSKNINSIKDHPWGLLKFLLKVLEVVAVATGEYSLILIKCLEVIFASVPLCMEELFFPEIKHSIYENLVVTMSASILTQDAHFQSPNILLRNILQEHLCITILSMDVYSLVISNIPPEECLIILTNLLYAVNDLECGFFTSRPEIVYLKILLQRMMRVLPNSLKEEIIKLFNSEEYIQIWRFLGFAMVPSDKIGPLLNLIIENTSKCIKDEYCTDTPFNVGEGLELLSSVNKLNTAESGKEVVILKFIKKFWSLDFNYKNILENNIMKYFVPKITKMSLCCIKESKMNFSVMFDKLILLCCKQNYWVSVYNVVSSILRDFNKTYEGNQELLQKTVKILSLALQNKINNCLIRETYLDLLRELNHSQNEFLNVLLDMLNPAVAIYASKHLSDGYNIPKVNTDSVFVHKCIEWKANINTEVYHEAKRPRLDLGEPNIPHVLQNKPSINSNKIGLKKNNRLAHEAPPCQVEVESTASEVIDRLKSEFKCLLYVMKTEKLTAKNVADLKRLMSQISSLM